MNPIRESRQVWVAAHPRRLPCRDTAVHDELRAAFLIDLIKLKRMESELAEAIEKELERE